MPLNTGQNAASEKRALLTQKRASALRENLKRRKHQVPDKKDDGPYDKTSSDS